MMITINGYCIHNQQSRMFIILIHLWTNVECLNKCLFGGWKMKTKPRLLWLSEYKHLFSMEEALFSKNAQFFCGNQAIVRTYIVLRTKPNTSHVAMHLFSKCRSLCNCRISCLIWRSMADAVTTARLITSQTYILFDVFMHCTCSVCFSSWSSVESSSSSSVLFFIDLVVFYVSRFSCLMSKSNRLMREVVKCLLHKDKGRAKRYGFLTASSRFKYETRIQKKKTTAIGCSLVVNGICFWPNEIDTLMSYVAMCHCVQRITTSNEEETHTEQMVMYLWHCILLAFVHRAMVNWIEMEKKRRWNEHTSWCLVCFFIIHSRCKQMLDVRLEHRFYIRECR